LGTFKVAVDVGSLDGGRWERVEAYADTGALFSSVPRAVWEGLGLTPARSVTFRLADGNTMAQNVGDGLLRLDGQQVHTTVVLGEAGSPCILGALAMEALLLAPDPVHQRLIPIEPVMLAELL
jgi:predicted aspartyl protease